ncbi:hypothetical protein [Trinickia diaoshuihuensis]|uniref:hypothetical protein n=1 Tax=Trinickia diaoshuihuensis TaxID=2292265 RepID=UPI000E2432E4|nr:hypothetical protein [Trinickia diaoshuihuensis]
MQINAKIRRSTVDSIFEGSSDDNWIGSISTSSELPIEFDGEYIPVVADKNRYIIGFNKYFIYNHDLDIYSYENNFLKTEKGASFIPAQNHRYLGVSIIDQTNGEIVSTSPICTETNPEHHVIDETFVKVFYAAIDHFHLAHPEIKQYIFEGSHIAQIVKQIEQKINTVPNPKLQLTTLSALAAPHYVFEVSRPSAVALDSSNTSAAH